MGRSCRPRQQRFHPETHKQSFASGRVARSWRQLCPRMEKKSATRVRHLSPLERASPRCLRRLPISPDFPENREHPRRTPKSLCLPSRGAVCAQLRGCSGSDDRPSQSGFVSCFNLMVAPQHSYSEPRTPLMLAEFRALSFKDENLKVAIMPK